MTWVHAALAALFLVPVLAPFSHAVPLNENCTVSILNRTAQVKADGTWDLPNVPAGFGPLRARATCVENGATTSGQSDPFTIQPNRMSGIVAFETGVMVPIPSDLTVSAPTTALTQTGATLQLTVTATYPDGATADVTADPGTTYRTTNPAIATVSAGGLVTATGTGRVIVSASNEMVLKSLLLSVTQGENPDVDGDGMDDAWELANGFNPNDPVDAVEDTDGDGLTNIDEFTSGTDPRNSDSDADGIADGEELVAGADGFVTNPLLADSDGDGIRDGLEIATGSDPTNPFSTNLAGALIRLEMTPARSVLVFNTITADASRQLTVAGHLLDGTTIDLTSRGSNYNSSDLSVVNFGAVPGEVFAGQSGTATITADNSGFTADAQVTVQTFSPTALSTLPMGTIGDGLAVLGDSAFVADATGVRVVDVTDRTAPRLIGGITTPGTPGDLWAQGSMLFVADGELRLYDITDPAQPFLSDTALTPGQARGIAMLGELAYVADGDRLTIIDTGAAGMPVVGEVPITGAARVSLSADGTTALVSRGGAGVQLVDVTDPTVPTLLGNVTAGDARDAVMEGTALYLADMPAGTGGGFTPVDVTDPNAPVPGTPVDPNTGGRLNDIAVSGAFAFGADTWFVNGVPIIDIGTPLAPVPRANLDFSGFGDADGVRVAVDDRYVYLTAADANTKALFIGQYRIVPESGTVAPTVQVVAPVGGAQLVEGATVTLQVLASDDVQVAAVTFLVNGAAVGSANAAPYTFDYTVPLGPGPMTIGAEAIDLAGNVGLAADVAVQVIADPGTTVAGHVTDQNGGPAVGVTVTCSGVSGVTDANGDFSIAGVPTVTGSIDCSVALTDGAGNPVDVPFTLTGVVPGGVTQAGEIRAPGGIGYVFPGGRFPFAEPVGTQAWTDLNLDGEPDLVTVATDNTLGEGVVRVLPGTGDARLLGTEARYPIGASYGNTAVPAVADLNRDTFPDVIVVQPGNRYVTILPGLGDGTLGVAQVLDFTYAYAPSWVAIGDLNGDLNPDLVSAPAGFGQMEIRLGNGDFTFTLQPRFGNGNQRNTAGVLADLDSNGNPELFIHRSSDRQMWIYPGLGDGTFGTPQTLATGTGSATIRVADFTGDGNGDVVTYAPSVGSGAVVYPGNGDGTVGTPFVGTSQGFPSDQMRGADFDGNGTADLFLEVLGTGDTATFFGNGDGTFGPPQGIGDLPSYAGSVGVVDIDGDGRLDLLAGEAVGAGYFLTLYPGAASGVFEGPEIMKDTLFYTPPRVADVNGDTFPDILRSVSSTAQVLPGDGSGSFTAPPVLTSSALLNFYAARIADLTGDDLPDLAAVTSEDGNRTWGVKVLRGHGDGAFDSTYTTPLLRSPTGNQAYYLEVTEVNGDASPDVVALSAFTGEVFISVGNGDGTFQTGVAFVFGAGHADIATGDLNGDGAVDLITAGGTNEVSVRLGNGDATFGALLPLTAGDNPTAVAVADMTGDGVDDIVVANATSQDLSLLRSNGDGTFQGEQRFTLGEEPESMMVTDLNGDQIADVVVGDSTGEITVVLFGTGGGNLSVPWRFRGGRIGQLVDVGTDGLVDVVGQTGRSGRNGYLLILRQR